MGEKGRVYIWIFGIGGSEVDDVVTRLIKGTKKQAFRYMMSRVKDDKENEKESWDSGTTSVKSIETVRSDHYYAYNTFFDHHIDYSLQRVDGPLDLSSM